MLKKGIWAALLIGAILCVVGYEGMSSGAAGTEDLSAVKAQSVTVQIKVPDESAKTADQKQNSDQESDAGLKSSDEEQSEKLPHEYPDDPASIAVSEEEKTDNDSTDSEGPPTEEQDVGESSDASASSEENEAEEFKHPEHPDGAAVSLDPGWEFADYSIISAGAAVMYRAQENRKNIIIGVNAGHGTEGGESVYTYCHPDYTPKVTGGTTAAGAVQATAVSSGMTFFDGTAERDVNLAVAQFLKELLLQNGYDVLMIRDGIDVQLDNIARTVICNNVADCHIAIHYDGDGLDYDKGSFYMSVPDGIKGMYPVSEIWPEDDRLGDCLIAGLSSAGVPVFEGGSLPTDLTQTSFSSVPSVDIELGNAASDHSEGELYVRAAGLLNGIEMFFFG